MDSFVLTLAEARVMYRRYHSLLGKGRKRLPGGEFWKELGAAFHGSGAGSELPGGWQAHLPRCEGLLSGL